MNSARAVAITGIGVIAPGGNGCHAFWDVVTSGASATRRISYFDPTPFRSQIAGECDFDPLREGLTDQQTRRMDRAAQLATVCARQAIQDSGIDLDTVDPRRVGVAIGSAVGAASALEREYLVLSNRGADWQVDERYASPFLLDHLTPTPMVTEVAHTVGAEGPSCLVSDGCTSGLDAVSHAADLILEGSADIMLAGASDTPITPIAVACFDAIRATSNYNDTPTTASRPFDATRNGFVLAEGAAVLLLEEVQHARSRGVVPYALVSGYATRCNAYHMTGLRPDGREMAEAIRHALRHAELSPSSIDYVNAHGSGTVQNDRHETAAFKNAFGAHAYAVPVSSIKSTVGHSLGAIGSIELAACALALRENVVPPTANLTTPDPTCDLDYVPLEARETPLDAVLSVGSGFGGFQTAVVLKSPRLEGRP